MAHCWCSGHQWSQSIKYDKFGHMPQIKKTYTADTMCSMCSRLMLFSDRRAIITRRRGSSQRRKWIIVCGSEQPNESQINHCHKILWPRDPFKRVCVHLVTFNWKVNDPAPYWTSVPCLVNTTKRETYEAGVWKIQQQQKLYVILEGVTYFWLFILFLI